jgi:hypothetical protein
VDHRLLDGPRTPRSLGPMRARRASALSGSWRCFAPFPRVTVTRPVLAVTCTSRQVRVQSFWKAEPGVQQERHHGDVPDLTTAFHGPAKAVESQR